MVNRLMFNHLVRLSWRCGQVMLLGALSVQAAEMKDPTRPPPGFSPTALAQSGTSGASDSALPAKASNQVSSLFLMRDQPYALVDGVIVRLGDPLAEGRVSRIDAKGVWIKTRQGVKQLEWLPEIVKTPPRARMEQK
jgi:hypothetical protein